MQMKDKTFDILQEFNSANLSNDIIALIKEIIDLQQQIQRLIKKRSRIDASIKRIYRSANCVIDMLENKLQQALKYEN